MERLPGNYPITKSLLRRKVKKGLESEGYRVGEDSASLPIPDPLWWGQGGEAWGSTG